MFIFGRFKKIYTKGKRKKIEINRNLASFENAGCEGLLGILQYKID